MRTLLPHALLWTVLVALLFPFAYMFGVSLVAGDATLGGVFSRPWTLGNYTDILSGGAFPRYVLNSIVVSTAITAANCVLCTMVAYVFARKEFRGKALWFATVMSVLVLPAQVVMIPLYRLMTAFGWINTWWALIVPWTITPFGVFMMTQYIKQIPRELDDAARMDGAGDWTILWRVVAPLAKPMLVLLVVFEFLASWNSFLFPFLFTNDESMRTLPVGLAFYLGKQSVDWAHLMAGASVAALPVIVLFIVFQRNIVAGLMAGALKQ